MSNGSNRVIGPSANGNKYRLRCEDCGQTFRYPSHLKTHYQQKHMGLKPEKSHVCNVCERAFSTTFNLNQHMSVHTGEKPFECNFCGKRMRCRRYLAKHESLHMLALTGSSMTQERNRFMCFDCGQGFMYPSHLNTHIRHKHLGVRTHICAVCQKAFSTNSNLSQHMSVHVGEKLFACRYCGKRMTHQRNMKQHEKLHSVTHMAVRMREKQFACRYCDKKMTHQRNMKQHEKLHTSATTSTNSDLTCVECGHSFINRYNLQCHMHIHSGTDQGKKFSCEICCKTFPKRSNLAAHALIHVETKPRGYAYFDTQFLQPFDLPCDSKLVLCPYCNKVIPGRTVISTDLSLDAKPYFCQYCGKQFDWNCPPVSSDCSTSCHGGNQQLTYNVSVSNLVCPGIFTPQLKYDPSGRLSQSPVDYSIADRQNILHEHRNVLPANVEKPYFCPNCPQTFGDAVGLLVHTNCFHRTDQSRANPYACFVCGKVASSAFGLAHHVRLHFSDKPYCCQSCDQSFSRPYNLRCHAMGHQNVKTFECEICGERFVLRKQLKVHHIRFHDIGHSYKCAECDKRFLCKSGLSRHLLKHNEEKPYTCAECGKSFKCHSSLVRHNKVNHNSKL